MNKVLPVALFITAVVGFLMSLGAMMLAIFSFTVLALVIPAVVILVISCIVNAFPMVLGLIFKSRICKAAMVISSIAYAIIVTSFILLASV